MNFKDVSEMTKEDIEKEISDLESLLKLKSEVTVEKLLNMELDTTCLKNLGVTMTPNGAVFDIEKPAFMSDIMIKFYNKRKYYKDLMLKCKDQYNETNDPEMKKLEKKYKNYEQAFKRNINGFYGCTSNIYFSLYDLRIAEGITAMGRCSIRYAEKVNNNFINKLLENDKEKDYTIAVDTDSNYLNFEDVVKKYMPKVTDELVIEKNLRYLFNDKLYPHMMKKFDTFKDYINAPENKISMKLEVIASIGFWKAPKCYALKVLSSEGLVYKKPELKIMGLEIVKSSTPQIIRDTLESMVERILEDDIDGVRKFVSDYRKQYKTFSPELIASPRGVNGISTYSDSLKIYKKGTPMHVRASLLYNKIINDKDLLDRYTPINEGDKIKFIYLKIPNPIRENVIAFLGEFPKEFELEKYIDYDTQFEKTFIKPLDGIMSSVGFDLEERNTLDEFFS